MQTAETAALRTAYAESLPDVCAPRLVGYSTPANGYAYPDRRALTIHGHAVTYWHVGDGTRAPAIALWRTDLGEPGTPAYRAATNAVYLVDNGRTVTPYYVAGSGDPDSQRDRDAMFLHQFPVNDRPAVGGAWQLPPSRAYHVILGRVTKFDTWHADRYGQSHAATAPNGGYWGDRPEIEG